MFLNCFVCSYLLYHLWLVIINIDELKWTKSKENLKENNYESSSF